MDLRSRFGREPVATARPPGRPPSSPAAAP